MTTILLILITCGVDIPVFVPLITSIIGAIYMLGLLSLISKYKRGGDEE